MAVPAGVDEPGGRVDEQAEPTEGDLPSSRATRSSGSATRSSVEPSTNSPGCRMNGVVADLDQLGEVLEAASRRCTGIVWLRKTRK